MSIDVGSGVLFYGGILVGALLGLFANEYVTLKYMYKSKDENYDLHSIKKDKNVALFVFGLCIVVAFLFFILLLNFGN